MTKKEFTDIVKFHYMSVQNPTCIRWESEDGSVYEEIDALKRQMFDNLKDLEFMDVCWTMASIIKEEE